MKSPLDYFLAQSLSLVFYIITLVIYNRARKEYGGGKIAAAINLILIFIIILLFSDFVDYFVRLVLPLGKDTTLIIKIILRLTAMCVLFFGGLKFFVGQSTVRRIVSSPDRNEKPATGAIQTEPVSQKPVDAPRTVPEGSHQIKPSLGRYEILEQIGRGASGIVYKGRDPKLQRLTAIKTIRFTDDFDEDQVDVIKEIFYREAKLLANLSHLNIVGIYDVGEDLDLTYLAMEYLEGESLEKYTEAGHLLPIRKCIDIVSQVCDALEHAHSHNIVHRDIKPANIMLLEDGLVKVTDFGIAHVTVSSKTKTGVIKGTPFYMSPEQTMGRKVTGPSDIFSLGVVFYQLLTGRFPFTGDSLSAVMHQITEVDPQPATTHNPKINKATLAILNRALEKTLDKRYRTAKQMGDHLRRLGRKMDEARHKSGR